MCASVNGETFAGVNFCSIKIKWIFAVILSWYKARAIIYYYMFILRTKDIATCGTYLLLDLQKPDIANSVKTQIQFFTVHESYTLNYVYYPETPLTELHACI